MSELKPCPFCGSSGKMLHQDYNWRSHWIVCIKCRMYIEEYSLAVDDFFNNGNKKKNTKIAHKITVDRLIKRWNTRFQENKNE